MSHMVLLASVCHATLPWKHKRDTAHGSWVLSAWFPYMMRQFCRLLVTTFFVDISLSTFPPRGEKQCPRPEKESSTASKTEQKFALCPRGTTMTKRVCTLDGSSDVALNLGHNTCPCGSHRTKECRCVGRFRGAIRKPPHSWRFCICCLTAHPQQTNVMATNL